MALVLSLRLVCAALLLVGGVEPQVVYIQRFSRAGDDITLPCDRVKHLGPTCLEVDWLHVKHPSSFVLPKVSEGKVKDSEASRLTLNSDCSLRLHKVAVNDSGQFICRLGNRDDSNTVVHLNVLTVSRAPPDSSSSITLECRLEKFDSVCQSGTFRWFGQTQTLLSGEKIRNSNCVSNLTVGPESPDSRTFTCRYEENSEVKVSAEFRLEGKGETPPTQAPDCSGQVSTGWWFLVLKTVAWSALICTTVVVSIYTREKETPKRSSGVFDMVICPVPDPGNLAPAADYENQK